MIKYKFLIHVREKVVKQMFYCQANSNDNICKQGDKGEYFFVLGSH